MNSIVVDSCLGIGKPIFCYRAAIYFAADKLFHGGFRGAGSSFGCLTEATIVWSCSYDWATAGAACHKYGCTCEGSRATNLERLCWETVLNPRWALWRISLVLCLSRL